MRASLFTAAVLAALVSTAWTPSDARAQVVISPSINTGSVSPVSYPAYYYGYGYNYPGYSTYSYGWTNPYSTYNWTWTQPYPVYTGYGYGSPYWRSGYYRGYRGWYRRW
jgi:hypothetical protein